MQVQMHSEMTRDNTLHRHVQSANFVSTERKLEMMLMMYQVTCCALSGQLSAPSSPYMQR